MLNDKSKKLVTSKQLFYLIAFLAPLQKFITLPSTLASFVGNDMWLVTLWLGVLDLLVLGIILLVSKFYSGSFFDLLKELFGSFVAKTVLALYGIYFLFSSLPFYAEQKLLMDNVIYQNASGFYLTIPLFLMVFYGGVKGFKGLSRTMEICGGLVGVSFLAILILALTAADFSEIFPVLENGITPVYRSVFFFAPWYNDFIFMLLLMGKVKDNVEKPKLKIFSCGAISVLFGVAFFILFTGVFGEIALKQTYAITKISKYSVSFSSIGRIDYLFITLVMLGFVAHSMLKFISLVECFSYIFKNRVILSVFAIVVVATSTFFISGSFQKFYSAFIKGPFSLYTIILCYILPLLLPLFAQIAKKKQGNSKSVQGANS